MALSMEEMLHKYCPNGNVDPRIPMEYARKLITPLVSYLYFSDGPGEGNSYDFCKKGSYWPMPPLIYMLGVKWFSKDVPDYIRDPNNSSNGRPKQKELMEMLKRIVDEYRARKREPDSSDVVDLLEQSEEIVNAFPDPTIDASGKYEDDEMLLDTFEDRITKLRDKNKEMMQWSMNKVTFDEQHEAYLNWIGRFIDKLDSSGEKDPNMLLAIRWIELVMKVYCKKNNMNSGSVENMESFVEHGKFEWTSVETDKDDRFGEPSSSIAEMYVNVQKPNPHGQYAEIYQNSNTSSKEDAIGQQQPSNLANEFPVKSFSAVDAMECHIAGDHTEEVVQSEDDGPFNQTPEDEMLAEEFVENKFKFEEDVEYEEDPYLGLYQDLRTDQLNSSNFLE